MREPECMPSGTPGLDPYSILVQRFGLDAVADDAGGEGIVGRIGCTQLVSVGRLIMLHAHRIDRILWLIVARSGCINEIPTRMTGAAVTTIEAHVRGFVVDVANDRQKVAHPSRQLQCRETLEEKPLAGQIVEPLRRGVFGLAPGNHPAETRLVISQTNRIWAVGSVR